MAIDPLEDKPKIAFDYIKGHNFSTYHVDGAVGGLTPKGDLHIAFYSERMAIPRRVTHLLNDDGSIGDIEEIESRNSVVREMDVNVVMSVQTAVELHDWLGERIEEMKRRRGEK
jgi:hypothetical protein